MNHNTYLLLPFMLLSFFSLGCTNQNWYEGLKSNQKLKCQQGPVSEYDECMKRIEDSYQDYKTKKQDAENE